MQNFNASFFFLPEFPEKLLVYCRKTSSATVKLRPSIVESSSSFCSFKLNAGCGGYLDFQLWFCLCFWSKKLWKMPRCNYVLIKLPNFFFIVVWRFTLFCPLHGGVYQKFMSGNLACTEPTGILRGSDTAYHWKRS